MTVIGGGDIDGKVVPVTIGELGGPVIGLARLSRDPDGTVQADIRLMPDVPVTARLLGDTLMSLSIGLPDGH